MPGQLTMRGIIDATACLAGRRDRPGRGGRSNLERIVLIGLAGAFGALSRYGIQSGVNELLGRPSVLGTLIVNLSGAFLLGLLLATTADRDVISPAWRTAGAVGFLGAYTTFSTLMFDSISRVEAGDVAAAVANLAASVCLGLIAVYAGLVLGRAV